MVGRSCAVGVCKNYSGKTKNQGVIYHRFPKEKNLESKSIREKWVRKCKRLDKFNPDNSQICSLHFTEDDYERDLKNELLNLPLKKILKKSAVPSLNLSSVTKSKSESYLARSERMDNINRKSLVSALLENNSTIKQEGTEDWKTKYQALFINYNNLKEEYNKLQGSLRKQEQLTKYYKGRYAKSEKTNISTEMLKQLFTPN